MRMQARRSTSLRVARLILVLSICLASTHNHCEGFRSPPTTHGSAYCCRTAFSPQSPREQQKQQASSSRTTLQQAASTATATVNPSTAVNDDDDDHNDEVYESKAVASLVEGRNRTDSPSSSSLNQVAKGLEKVFERSVDEEIAIDVAVLEMVTEIVSENAECEVESQNEEQKNVNEESDEEHGNDNKDVVDADDEESGMSLEERRQLAMRASLLWGKTKRARPSRKQPKSTGTNTKKESSVGPRRVGSASRARENARVAGKSKTAKLWKGIRSVAAASSSGDSKQNDDSTKESPSAKACRTQVKHTSHTVIRSTIDNILSQQKKRQNEVKNPVPVIEPFPSPSDQLQRKLGEDMHPLLQYPSPGTIFSTSASSRQGSTSSTKTLPITVRVATRDDDFDIARLRLSVFSNFNPSVQQQFCIRSQQLLNNRRQRGATCLVATSNVDLCHPAAKDGDYGKTSSSHTATSSATATTTVLVGSLEASIHEFQGSQLGSKRPMESMLYITEVAVHPATRRNGVGRKLMEGMDELARRRGNVESLYLHVDVENEAAIRLYESCGYQIVTDDDDKPGKLPTASGLYEEFTRRLNLHDGATKGRRHHLLVKHLVPSPTWIITDEDDDDKDDMKTINAPESESDRILGFVIPQ